MAPIRQIIDIANSRNGSAQLGNRHDHADSYLPSHFRAGVSRHSPRAADFEIIGEPLVGNVGNFFSANVA
jgi:hypothetical protein